MGKKKILRQFLYSNSSVPVTLNGTVPVLDRYRSGTGPGPFRYRDLTVPGHDRDTTVLRK